MDARVHDGPGAPIVRLRWVYTDQPFLPVGTQCVVNNRIWNEDQESDLTVGQVQPDVARYAQDERWQLPPGLPGDHMCNPQWLATGEPWPTTLPPTKYGPSWIPECCGLFEDATAGGIEIGGEVGDEYRPPDATAGGIEIGGQVGDEYRPPDATAGGIEVGGEVGDEYTPAGGVAPGPSCALAGEAALFATNDATTSGSGTEQWWHFDGLTPGATYRLTVAGLGIGIFQEIVYRGASCGALVQENEQAGNGSSDWVHGAGGDAWLKVLSSVAGDDYTVKIEQLP